MAVMNGRSTSITIPDDLCRLLDRVRVQVPSAVPPGARTDQKLILWLAREHARSLLAPDE